MRSKPRRLGLLGGITWHSSIDYERALNEGVNDALGGSSSADLIVRSYDFQQIAEAQANGDWDGLAATFAKDARVLVEAGFRLEKVLPVDQFVWSPHIELVGVFTR